VHARTLIRDLLKSKFQGIPLLETYITFDLADVTSSERLPWLYLWLDDEEIQQNTTGRKTRPMAMNVDVIFARGEKALIDAESIAGVVEDRLDSDPTLGRKVMRIQLQSLSVDRDFDVKRSRLRLTYSLMYSTAAGNSGALL
jgi:hypothetical protein